MIGCGLSLFVVALAQAGGILWGAAPPAAVDDFSPWGAMPIGAEF